MSTTTLPVQAPRPKVKRKPPPPIDARYPSPDPQDPFAPLWVLRSRSSNPKLAISEPVHTLQHKASYELYPTFLDDASVLSDVTHGHYRRRSHSIPAQVLLGGIAFPEMQPARDWVQDDAGAVTSATEQTSGSAIDADPAPVSASPPKTPRRPIKLARLLLGRTPKSPALNSTPRMEKPPSHERPDSAPTPSTTHSTSCLSFVDISHPSISTSYSDDARAYTDPRPVPGPHSAPLPISTSAPLRSTSHSESRHSTHLRHSHHPFSLSSLSLAHRSTRAQSTPADAVEPEWAHPTPAQLARAGTLSVIASSGLRVPFAALFAARRTIVLFVRHFWCPLCQDYMFAVAHAARPEHMFYTTEDEQRRAIDLVVISNGSPAFIPKYRQLFGLPFELYTDPTLAVYTALGMGRASASPSPSSSLDTPATTTPMPSRPSLCSGTEDTCGAEGVERPGMLDGGYVRHGLVGGIAMVVMRALKFGMPVWEKGGDIQQLGGEFVLGPGLTCTYAHRMQSPKGHVPIQDVLAAAGIDLPPPTPPTTPLSTTFSRSLSRVLPPLRNLSTLSLTRRTPQPHPSSASTPQPQGQHPRRRNSTNTHYDSRRAPITTSSHHPHNMREFGAWRRRSVDSSTRDSPPRRVAIATEGGARERRTSVGFGHGFGMTQEEEAAWMAERTLSLERLRERKSERRGAFVGYFRGGAQGGVGEETAFAVGLAVSENGHCSPVVEETDVDADTDAGADADVETVEGEGGTAVESVVDGDGVMVIGFVGGAEGRRG